MGSIYLTVSRVHRYIHRSLSRSGWKTKTRQEFQQLSMSEAAIHFKTNQTVPFHLTYPFFLLLLLFCFLILPSIFVFLLTSSSCLDGPNCFDVQLQQQQQQPAYYTKPK